MHRKDAVVSAERLKIASNLAAHKIQLISGMAEFEDPHTVKVVDSHGAARSLRGEAILTATGSKPHRPSEIPLHSDARGIRCIGVLLPVRGVGPSAN
jgi:NAD(P) transhydrogenase